MLIFRNFVNIMINISYDYDSGMTCYLLDNRHQREVCLKPPVDTSHVHVVTTLSMLESSCQNQFRSQASAKHLPETYQHTHTYISIPVID